MGGNLAYENSVPAEIVVPLDRIQVSIPHGNKVPRLKLYFC
jgi:hypothetical protein